MTLDMSSHHFTLKKHWSSLLISNDMKSQNDVDTSGSRFMSETYIIFFITTYLAVNSLKSIFYFALRNGFIFLGQHGQLLTKYLSVSLVF